ncbi:MAG: HD domain-containing protein [Candidatus Cloacimonadota bacterium]|jgi:putative hydrolase of HD superfamily|nr:MAG: HD domain-containing protein [Candidatus Cloacimonadota bacterium]
MNGERLRKQIDFIVEIDKLKHILRRTYIMDNSRHENDVEHSWHLAIMTLLLSEYAEQEKIDILHVVKMVLIHDIVEIDAGDTFCYDEQGQKERVKRERKAAERLFSILPEDQTQGFRALWEEFEERKTPEARFAASLDRLQPLLHNYYTKGFAWRENSVTSDMVFDRNKHIEKGSPSLWKFAKDLIEESIKKGYLPK